MQASSYERSAPSAVTVALNDIRRSGMIYEWIGESQSWVVFTKSTEHVS